MEEAAGDKQPQKRRQTVESSLDQLEEVLKKLEDEETPLEQSFSLYERGMKLVKEINEKIDRVEKKLIVLEGENHE